MAFILMFLLSCAITYLSTPLVIKLAKKYRLVTDPKKSKHPAHTHKGIVPRAGGVPIVLAIVVSSLIFLPLQKVLIGVLIAAVLLVILGLLDDYYDLSPYLRFALNIAISLVAIGAGLGIPYISNPFGGVIPLDTVKITFQLFGTHTIWLLADIFALLWLTWTTNSINWSKGVDGQMPGFVAIAAMFIGLFADKATLHSLDYASVVALCMIVSGAFAGFVPHNFYPQKIMPGYGGGALAGFMLGALSILSFAKVGTLLFILAIPTIDALYTMVRRIISGKSPFKGDRGHFHHRLLSIGWGRRRIAVFYWLVTFILGYSSLFFTGLQKALAFVGVMVLMLIFIIVIEQTKKVVGHKV